MSTEAPRSSLAVLIPCYNEGQTVGKVVRDFARVLPDAAIYVFDNNSTDNTAREAQDAGAIVFREKRQGKGNVVASMLQKVDADYYLMVDGDDTYPAEMAPELLKPLYEERADMVVGQRLATYAESSFRPLHVSGNKLVRSLINWIFSAKLRDILSGYRAFTREVALSLPVVASGFDIETEMTLQLLYRRFVITEMPIAYRARPEGSFSKLRTVDDGILVLLKILGVLKAYKPLTFFGGLAVIIMVTGLVVGYYPIREYIEHRYVFSVPKAILAASCVVVSLMLAAIGVTLHTINFRILEMTQVLVKQVSRANERSGAESRVVIPDRWSEPLARPPRERRESR